jgi:hypothetical protein
MVRERAVELAVISGRLAQDATKSDWEQAKRELTGEPDMDPKDAILEAAPESERWDPLPGSTGHKVRVAPSGDEDDEGRSDNERLAPVVSVQNQYNLADRRSEDVLSYCTEEKIGFIPWFPLAADGRNARKLVVALERGDLITIREQGRRSKHTARLIDVRWWMLRYEADKALMEMPIRSRSSGIWAIRSSIFATSFREISGSGQKWRGGFYV